MSQDSEEIIYTNKNNPTIKLHEEQLSIYKNMIKTGDVKVRKEIVNENLNFTIPIVREYYIIEKSDFTKSNDLEAIRIPLSEEQVEFKKHKVILNDVSIYHNQFEDIKTIEETIKKEDISIQLNGDVEIKDN